MGRYEMGCCTAFVYRFPSQVDSFWLLIDEVFDTLLKEPDDRSFRAIIALGTEIQKRLKIETPKTAPEPTIESSDEKVTITCSDGEIISSKNKLIELSPVLRAMFEHIETNSFSESQNPNKINLQNVKIANLTMLLKENDTHL